MEEPQLETLANASPILNLPISSSVPAAGTALPTSTSYIKELPVVLKRTIEILEQNYLRSPHGRRYDTVLKNFATSLYLYAGPVAYEFVHANLNIGLPCSRTIQGIIHKDYKNISEGQFRFDELLSYLQAHDCSFLISIGEDATRLVGRVDYDPETDRLVGFVLPLDQDSLPIIDSFVAVSFEAMENYFMTERIAKYAFVYMAQPLTSSIPPFCLCCYGTDNSFTAEDVLKRWKYIQLECEKRGIKVISYGADGDSREVRAMRISAFHLTDPLGTYSPSFSLPEINIPKEWCCSWYAIQKPVSVAYIQDPVHLAVKLKARLLKPSICLPLGYLVASSGHLHLLRDSYSKDVHGI